LDNANGVSSGDCFALPAMTSNIIVSVSV
jgi:hypothetical protein